MFSKILAGVFAVAVLTVGGYAYWNYSNCPCAGPTDPPPARSSADESVCNIPPCCQEPSRSRALECDPGCCGDLDTPSSPEVLAIQPREVK